MDIKLSDSMQRIKPSPTLAVNAKAQKLIAEGKDIIALGVGEPDFDTPKHIKQAAIQAIESGKTKYTAVDGIPGLKQAVCQKMASFNKLTYQPSQTIISTGGKQAIFNMVLALLNPGDEAIIPAPYWVSYYDMVLFAGGKPVVIDADIKQHFKITPEQLSKAITPNTRLFFINSPSNPTGVGYTRQELQALGKVLAAHPNIIVATDDMYEYIWWAKEPFSNIVMACPELYNQTVVLNGVSKAYAMTGWRLGYACGPEKLIKAMNTLQGQSTSNACSISQAAAEAALRGPQDSVVEMVQAFKLRHDYLVESLNNLPYVQCLPGDGTFYAFAHVQDFIDRQPSIQNDLELADYLLQEAGVAVVPGSAFGAEGYMRLSFASDKHLLESAISRLAKVFK